MFADDTHLIYADNDTSNIESCLSEDLLNMNANKRTKTEFMLTGCGPRVNTLIAPHQSQRKSFGVEQVLTKSLGVTIDDKLCWNCHIEKLTKKIACGIGDMKRVSNLIPQATLHLIYQALAQSHFNYGSTVWGACGKIAE